MQKIIHIENIELYMIALLFVTVVWLIVHTIQYYRAGKRKVKNLHRFAKAGETEAQSHLARHYKTGNMVKKDCQQAAFWYQKAAFSGDEDAKGHLEVFLNRSKSKIRC